MVFQSLFFWIHFYNPAERVGFLSRIKVSILVFLDSLLQRNEGIKFLVRLAQFQSLFFWIHFYN